MSFWKRERPCLTAVFSSVHRSIFISCNPQLTVKTEGEYLIVTSDAYARSVEIKNEEDRLLLEDNYFDMQPGHTEDPCAFRKYGRLKDPERLRYPVSITF